MSADQKVLILSEKQQKVYANKLLTHAELAKHLSLASSTLRKIILAKDNTMKVKSSSGSYLHLFVLM
jgi:hypothetical protein